jgi:hypothetical protein
MAEDEGTHGEPASKHHFNDSCPHFTTHII